MNKAFAKPQLQSKIGILVIFTSSFYKVLKAVLISFAYLLFSSNAKAKLYILLGFGVVGLLSLIYSFFYYKKFKFHIDYEQKEFVLQKGVFSTEFINIPFDKIQQVYFKRSIIQRVINVYEVAIDTAGSSQKEVTIKALSKEKADLIIQVCDELLAGAYENMFPLHVWMTGSGTQFNMNVNEVISNRCCQLSGEPLGSKSPVHPNDHVNMSQSTNDNFPTAMHIAAARGTVNTLLPNVRKLRDSLHQKEERWKDIIKIGRTHLQDATPLTLGQEISGYVGMLDDNIDRIENALNGVFRLCMGGTAVGTGINTDPSFADDVAQKIAELTSLPFCSATNKFTLHIQLGDGWPI